MGLYDDDGCEFRIRSPASLFACDLYFGFPYVCSLFSFRDGFFGVSLRISLLQMLFLFCF